ncbi:RDD family protein [Pedobacter frigoris]|uniref:RDD family protein n=1 Tax=Pedobacter frigoris TaxID=2571272 RepID=A0A4U1CQ92_9SPHI|nr:RDD family protein [Pedobacter frigoris]TKC07604.1 RDD family protein [Pedobacter frigoris]
METVKVNTSQHVDIDYPVAGIGERIAARLIDLACFIGLYILFVLLALLTNTISSGDIAFIVVISLYVASYIFYNLICEVFMNGQCIGKRLMKIRVVSLDGGQASIGQYFIRWVFRLVDFLLTAQIGGLICIALSEKKQRIGDIVAGTTVIKTVPRTTSEHIAFHPTEEKYTAVFHDAHELSDRDLELIHEVITTYYKTGNPELVYSMAAKIADHLSLTIPEGMNQMEFLKTIVKDYNYITAVAE